MEYLSFLSFVPKTAFVALFFVTIFIVYEIANIFNLPKKLRFGKNGQKKEKKLTPVKFPKEDVSFKLETEKTNGLNKRLILIILIFLAVLVVIIAGFFAASQNQNIQKQASTPTPSPVLIGENPTITSIPTLPLLSPTISTETSRIKDNSSTESAKIGKTNEIKIYRILNNKWMEIDQEALKLLSTREVVYISAFSDKNYPKAIFKVNDQIVEPSPSTQVNPFGELYVKFTIPPGEKDFKLEVSFLKS